MQKEQEILVPMTAELDAKESRLQLRESRLTSQEDLNHARATEVETKKSALRMQDDALKKRETKVLN